MKNQTIINLELFKTPGSRVFTGRDRGKEVRSDSKIDILEKDNDEIIILIPEDIGSINPSFLEEFLLNVVTKLQPEQFYNKFHFVNEGRYKITNDLQEAVDRIVREENALTN